jgi:hypothetical protein
MKLLIIILLSLLNGFFKSTINDPVYYVKVSNVRTYMNVDRTTVTEYWFTKDKFCILNSNQIKTVIRRDLGVTYSINLRAGTYKIDSIKIQKQSLPVDKILDFKYIGQSYVPDFEWNKPKRLPVEMINKFECAHYISEGDADFDQMSLEFLVAKTEDQFMANTVNSRILNIDTSNNNRKPIAGLISTSKNLIIMRIIERVENAIAPPATTKITIDNLEKVESANGFFDLPDNLKKTN